MGGHGYDESESLPVAFPRFVCQESSVTLLTGTNRFEQPLPETWIGRFENARLSQSHWGIVRDESATGLMSHGHSVSEWIAALKLGDLESVQKLWDRYRLQLIDAARQRLSLVQRTPEDEDDISQSVLIAIWRGAAAGRFDDVRNRDELWWTLLKITKYKVIDSARGQSAQKRGGKNGRTDVSLASDLDSTGTYTFQTIVGDQVTHDTIVALEDETTVILRSLRNATLRRIAEARIEGYTASEIAERLSIPQRSVERKLKLIRDQWSRELERVGAS
jgi:DNA-directed RNA polymerase specialized sigma24 family protein